MSSKEDYERYFVPQDYVKEWAGLDMSFYPDALHRLFSTGVVKGDTYLEYGAGPVFHSVAAVCPFVKEITMAEMVPQNRHALTRWLDDEKDVINWDDYICRYVRLDAKSTEVTEASIDIRKTLMRSKVKNVIACDAILPNPLTPIEATFDVVGTSLTIECALGSTYRERIKNASNLVKSGGYFIQFVAGAPATEWRCGNTFFKCPEVQTFDDCLVALNEAGFNVLETDCLKLPPYEDYKYDGKEMLLIVCRKI
ncbi:unnamed protein product [Owenia fusiformis]|uniref:N-methyltransferase n=1 Tax=Owenia fusiformis TaxID=6347 RepID=A0A8S4NHE4_OWEFU|nr:unnamed protein product [Owenia fusiformis]